MIKGVPRAFTGTIPSATPPSFPTNIVQITNPRGKPSFARQMSFTNNSSTNPMSIYLGNEDSAGTGAAAPAETPITVPKGATKLITAVFSHFTVKGTTGDTWEADCTVAG